MVERYLMRDSRPALYCTNSSISFLYLPDSNRSQSVSALGKRPSHGGWVGVVANGNPATMRRGSLHEERLGE